jgi:hypothetical protein
MNFKCYGCGKLCNTQHHGHHMMYGHDYCNACHEAAASDNHVHTCNYCRNIMAQLAKFHTTPIHA